MLRLWSSSRFSAFRSLCTMLRQWQKWTAATICLNFFLASFSAIRPWATRWSVRARTHTHTYTHTHIHTHTHTRTVYSLDLWHRFVSLNIQEVRPVILFWFSLINHIINHQGETQKGFLNPLEKREPISLFSKGVKNLFCIGDWTWLRVSERHFNSTNKWHKRK